MGKSGWIYQDLFFRNFIRTSSVLIRKVCLDKVGVFDETFPICEEIDLWLRIAREYPIGFIDNTLAVYTDNPDGMSTDRFPGREIWIEVLKKNYDPGKIPEKLYKKRLSRIYQHAGKYHMKKKQIAKARQNFRKSLQLNLLNVSAWFYIASLKLNKQE